MQAARVRKVSFVPPPDAADGAVTSLAYDPGTHIQSTVYAGTNVEQVWPSSPWIFRILCGRLHTGTRLGVHQAFTELSTQSKLGLDTSVSHLAPAALQPLDVFTSGLAWA